MPPKKAQKVNHGMCGVDKHSLKLCGWMQFLHDYNPEIAIAVTKATGLKLMRRENQHWPLEGYPQPSPADCLDILVRFTAWLTFMSEMDPEDKLPMFLIGGKTTFPLLFFSSSPNSHSNSPPPFPFSLSLPKSSLSPLLFLLRHVWPGSSHTPGQNHSGLKVDHAVQRGVRQHPDGPLYLLWPQSQHHRRPSRRDCSTTHQANGH